MATFRTSRPVSAADVGAPHVVLVGLPGAGKTTAGRAAAAALGRNFLDFDEEIERREGRSVSEIFAASGEPRFRALEKRLTEELCEVGNFVLAPGGGWIVNPGCFDLLRPRSTTIYLQVDPRRALDRLKAGVASRPLLMRADPLLALKNLLVEREQSYLLANHTVRVDFLREKEVVAHIVALAGGQRPD